MVINIAHAVHESMVVLVCAKLILIYKNYLESIHRIDWNWAEVIAF